MSSWSNFFFYPGRIYDTDEEYDSELDDFIDDGPEEESEDYSKYISEIFGYDKSRYRACDDDDANMESNFAQQLKEEFVSTKIGKCHRTARFDEVSRINHRTFIFQA